MKYLTFLFIVILFGSCSTSNSVNLPNLPTNTSKEISIIGKWNDRDNDYTIFIEEELEKIVISNGCEIVSANFKKFLPAMTFINIIKTQNTCNQNYSNFDQILKHTVFIKSISGNKIGFYNEKNEELIILSKIN